MGQHDVVRERATAHSDRHRCFSRRSLLTTSAAAAIAPQVFAEPAKNLPQRSVIYIFLSGGLGQQDSFDMKPEMPSDIRGEFSPISTQTPGLQICEHMPRLAACSNLWTVCRSLSHPYNEHSEGHMAMLSGRTPLPVGFSSTTPRPTDHPSIAALMGTLLPERNRLPSSIVLPEKLIHRTGRVIPGQFAGVMGKQRDPWILASSRFNAKSYGAWPEYEFHHQRGSEKTDGLQFRTPALSLPDGVSGEQLSARRTLLSKLELQKSSPDDAIKSFDRYRERAMDMLQDGNLSRIFDVHAAPDDEQRRYGRNTFGWSLMLSRRLVESGVGFVQVNLGNNETWDTHGNAFPHLKNYLFPPTDRAISALLQDLHQSGLLESTLVVVAGEFGRTPDVFRLPAHYKGPGRDHWGAVQSLLLAGCGFGGGGIIGSTDSQGGEPTDDKKSPENLAATMYSALGFSRDTQWFDLQNRPMQLFNDDPIPA